MRLYLVQKIDSLKVDDTIGIFQHKWKAEHLAREVGGFVKEFKLKQHPDEGKSFEFEYLEFEQIKVECFKNER